MVESEEEEEGPRCVFLAGELTEEVAAEIADGLLRLSHQDMERTIQLHILASPGGSAPAGMALVDLVQSNITAPVDTYVWGEACSSAALILAAGRTRYAGPNAAVMVHGLSLSLGSERGTSGLLVTAHAYRELEERSYVWLDRTTGKEPGYWRAQVQANEEVWLDPKGAVEAGLVDVVVL